MEHQKIRDGKKEKPKKVFFSIAIGDKKKKSSKGNQVRQKGGGLVG